MYIAERLALTAAVAALAAAPARAATWSTPSAYDRPTCHPVDVCVSEPAPRVAVNARGVAVAAWIDTHERVRAAVATHRGRFGAATTLGSDALRPAPAVGPDGTVTIVWEAGRGTLRFARRPAGRAHFGRSAPLAPRGSTDGDEMARAAAQSDGSVVVIYQSGDNVRSVTISRAGKPRAPVTLGAGSFAGDSVGVAPDGTLAACCVQPVSPDPGVPADTAAKLAVYRSKRGWRFVPASAVGEDEIETTYGTVSALVLATIRVRHSGDAGVLGLPGLARAGADDVVGAPLRPRSTNPNTSLAPDVTVDGSGRSVLVFQQKTAPQAFQRTAPVYASVAAAGASAFGARQRLDARKASEPSVRPLGRGAIAVWQAPDARWGVAIERNGTFRHAAAPSGPGPEMGLGEDALNAFDLATHGSRAVLAWIAPDGSVRVSELR